MDEVIKIIYNMDYDFDDTKVKPIDNPTLVQATPIQEVVNHKSKKSIGASVTKFSVSHNGLLKSSNKSFKRMYMEVTVSFTNVPRGIYEIYLNNPNDSFSTSSEHFVGFMNFFGFDSKTQSKSCTKGCCTPVNSEGRPYTVFYYELDPNTGAAGDYNIAVYKHNKVSSDLIIESVRITGR